MLHLIIIILIFVRWKVIILVRTNSYVANCQYVLKLIITKFFSVLSLSLPPLAAVRQSPVASRMSHYLAKVRSSASRVTNLSHLIKANNGHQRPNTERKRQTDDAASSIPYPISKQPATQPQWREKQPLRSSSGPLPFSVTKL
jgi:hypothetical protein